MEKNILQKSSNEDVDLTNEDALGEGKLFFVLNLFLYFYHFYIFKDPNEVLGMLVMEALTILLNTNNNNANVFRESGGAKCIHDMVKFKHSRDQVLGIIRELILSAGGDDDMLFILSTMHSAPSYKIELKIQILKALLGCLRDSHRTRTIFRKVIIIIENSFYLF